MKKEGVIARLHHALGDRPLEFLGSELAVNAPSLQVKSGIVESDECESAGKGKVRSRSGETTCSKKQLHAWKTVSGFG